MKRRDFVQVCAAGAAGMTLPTEALPATPQNARKYRRAKLVDDRRERLQGR